MILLTNLLGTEQMVKDRIRKYRDASVTTLRIQPEGTTLAECIENLGRVVTLIREVSMEEPVAAR